MNQSQYFYYFSYIIFIHCCGREGMPVSSLDDRPFFLRSSKNLNLLEQEGIVRYNKNKIGVFFCGVFKPWTKL